MKGKNIGLKHVLPFLFMGVAGTNLAAADVSNSGILSFNASEPMEQVVAEAQSWYSSHNYDVSESVIKDYVENGGTNLMNLPNLTYYLAGDDFPAGNTAVTISDSVASVVSSDSSIPPLSDLTSLADVSSVSGSEGATLYVLPDTDHDLVNLLIEPLEGGRSAVLLYKVDGADGFSTYPISNGLPAQDLIDGINPQSENYTGALHALSEHSTYAASMLDGVGNDEVTISGKSLYRFALTGDELRGLGNGRAKIIVVEYDNNQLDRGFQALGETAANEVIPHSHFYFRMNGSPDTIEFSSEQTFEESNTVDLHEPVVEETETVVLPGVNTPTSFGSNVQVNYNADLGQYLLNGLALYDADGIASAEVEVTRDGNPLGVFPLSGFVRSTQTYQNGSIASDSLKGLAYGDYDLTVIAVDSLGEEATRSYSHNLEEQNLDRVVGNLRARSSKDGSTLDLSGAISDENGFVAPNCFIEIYRGDNKIANINPAGDITDAYELSGIIEGNEIDLSKLNIALPNGVSLEEGDVVKVYTADRFDTMPQENEIPVSFKASSDVSGSYGLDMLQDGLTITAGLGLGFATEDVLPSLYPGQVSTSSDTPQTSLGLGVAWRGNFADTDLARFSADATVKFLLGETAEGLSIDDSMEISNYLREGADVLVRAGYNPRVLDGILEMYAGGVFGYSSRSTDLNRDYDFVFNEGASSIPMTDRISDEQSIVSGGLEASVKYNPIDFLSIGASIDWLSLSGEGNSTLKSMSAFNEQSSEYNINGNVTTIAGHLAGYLPKLAGLHDLILSGYLGYRFDSTTMTNLDTNTVMAEGADGVVGGAKLTYNFNNTFGGYIGYDSVPGANGQENNVSIGVRFTPTSLGNRD